jgi:two-component system sensor histidine kinase KdpD
VGLGLAICRSIMDAHGGDIQAANREGGGACVTIRLPLGNPPAVEDEP